MEHPEALRLAISAPLPDGTTYRNEGVRWLRLRWARIVDDWVLEDTIALQGALDQLQSAAERFGRSRPPTGWG